MKITSNRTIKIEDKVRNKNCRPIKKLNSRKIMIQISDSYKIMLEENKCKYMKM